MTKTPEYFWCDTCRRYTVPQEATEVQIENGIAACDEFWCERCSGDYQCDECGAEIDREGICQREEGCPSNPPSNALPVMR